MEVHFANRRLRRCFENHSHAQQRWGVAVARKYIQRIEFIKAAQNLNALQAIRSFRLHPLSGQRAGQFAIDLNDRWRMIFIYQENERVVRILEVTNHYGD